MNYALNLGETQIILATRNSAFVEMIEAEISANAALEAKLVDMTSSALLDDPIFFSGLDHHRIRQMVTYLFLLYEDAECLDTRLVEGIFLAVVRYLYLRSGVVTVREICITAALFFDRPVGDETEYSNRLDEIIEVYSTGVHVYKDEHRRIPGCQHDEMLARYWGPIRGYFKQQAYAASVALKLRKAIETYSVRGQEKSKFPVADKPRVVVIEVDGCDSSRDGMALAYFRCLLRSMLEEDVSSCLKGQLDRVIIESTEDKPSIPGFSYLVRRLAQERVHLNLHYSSLPGFRLKHSIRSSEYWALFNSRVYLAPSDPESFRDIQLQTGLSLCEIASKSQCGGWSLSQSGDSSYITWKYAGEAYETQDSIWV